MFFSNFFQYYGPESIAVTVKYSTIRMFYAMKSIFQIALLTLSLVAVTVVSGMYMADAAPTKHFKDWCYETLGRTVCGFESKQDCNASREIAEAADPNVSKCQQIVGKI